MFSKQFRCLRSEPVFVTLRRMDERVPLLTTALILALMLGAATAQDLLPATSGWLDSHPQQGDAAAGMGMASRNLTLSLNQAADASSGAAERSTSSRIWSADPGAGFRAGAQELGFGVGAGLGMKTFGSSQAHDWVLGIAQYGWMLSGMVAPNHWYRGNWELMGEVLGGQQFKPEGAYFVGVAPLLRYNFACGRRFVPFADAGAGLTATAIRDGDLSTTFEFNLQLGGGVHIFLSDCFALTFQYRYIHLSNASLQSPNHGVNTSNALAGVTWFF